MTPDADPARKSLRWTIYGLLIVVAAGQMTGRILAVNSIDLVKIQAKKIQVELEKSKDQYVREGLVDDALGPRLARREQELRERVRYERPFLSANDRSRWCTIRALVEHGTYAIDPIVTNPDEHSRWSTIDMVKHGRNDGPHLYSSKPTLLPTLLAGEYWLIHKATGLTLRDDPHAVVRIMLLTINVLPLMLAYVLIAGLVERFGTTDWGRVFVMASATFGTYLMTFSVTLNNHIVAAVSATIAIYAAVRIWADGERSAKWFVVAGGFAAFTAANELPAMSLLGLLGLGLLFRAPRPTLLYGVPAVLLVTAAALGTNYAAHRTVVPPYAHREAGKDWQTGNWYDFTYQVGSREISSYWKRDDASLQKRGSVDLGEASRPKYVFHCLIGHHGVFSLTPVWLLSAVGGVMLLRNRSEPPLRVLGWLVVILSVVCFGFFMMQGMENRNYGGRTSGLRWLFWLIPLWLLAMMPAADWLAKRRAGKIFASFLLLLSVASASYPTWNPWSHPWIVRWLDWL